MNMKKIILASTLSALLVACGGNEHGPSFGHGGKPGGNGSGNKPVKPGENWTDQPGVQIDPDSTVITQHWIDEAREGGTVNLRWTDSEGHEFDIQGLEFAKTNQDGGGIILFKDNTKMEMATMVGKHSAFAIYHSKTPKEDVSYSDWKNLIVTAKDVPENQFDPSLGTVRFEGEGMGLKAGNPMAQIGKSDVSFEVDFLNNKLSGDIKEQAGANTGSFGDKGIHLDGMLDKDGWRASAQLIENSNHKGYASGSFMGKDTSEMVGGYYIYDTGSTPWEDIENWKDFDVSHSGGFIANKK